MEEVSNNTPEPAGEDPGDTSASTPETENETEDSANSNSDVKADENNPEESGEEAESNLFAQVTEYKNTRPLLCGLKIAQQDKNSRITSDPLDEVNTYFAENLNKNGYQAKLVLDSPDTKVYQISKDGQDGYLHLFDQSGEGTVILFSQERIDCDRLNIQSLKPEDSGEIEEPGESGNTQQSETSEELKEPEEEKTQELKQSELVQKLRKSKKTQKLKKIELVQKLKESKETEKTEEEKVFEKTFASLYEKLGLTEDPVIAKADENQSPNPGMETVFNADVDKTKTPDELASVVKSKLEEQGFETSQIEDYTDGVLYEVKKGEFTKYITFTPNFEQTKVTIVTWKSSPVAPQKG